MERVAIKKWAKQKTKTNKWNIWKAFLKIFLITMLMIFLLILIIGFMYSFSSNSYADALTFIDMIFLVMIFTCCFFIIGYSTSMYRYFKIIVKDDVANLRVLNIPVAQCLKQALGFFAVTFVCILGMMAFIIPGFILAFGLSMTPYLLANYHEFGIIESMLASWNMMKGKKLKLFVMLLSFYGWMILSGLTLGILFIWLLPYMVLSFTKFFLETENEFYGVVSEETSLLKQDVEEFATMNNLKIDGRNNAYGMFNDYPVIVMFSDYSNDLVITIDTVGTSSLGEYFNNIKSQLVNIKTINYKDGRMTINLIRSKELYEVYEVLNRITLKLKDLNFLPSCETCHNHKSTSFYEYRGQLMNLCEDCKNAIVGDEKEVIIENTNKGIIGAMIGAIIGGIVWVAVYQIGFVVALIGYLIFCLAFNGYRYMAGKVSKRGLIISIICSVGVLLFAEIISIGLQIKSLMHLNSFIAAFSHIPYFLSFNSILVVVIKDLVIGMLFMAIAIFQYIYKIKNDIDEDTIKKLD